MAAQDDDAWRAFIDGPVYKAACTPWRDDPAFAIIMAHAGLRENIGGHATPALRLALGWVQATARIDLCAMVQAQRPAQGLCLGFGMHALEAYDLLQVFGLDRVHAYEWIGAQVIEAAQVLSNLCADMPDLPARIRLYHQTIGDLRALATASIQVVYTASVFNQEIPMSRETFSAALREILRVLADGGVVLIRGSSGMLEEHLAPHGCMLLRTPLLAVFRKAIGAPDSI